MNDNKMNDILSNFTNAVNGDGTDTATGNLTVNAAAASKNQMKSLLEGLDATQKSVNQMPGTHKMGKSTATKHPASKYLVGGEFDEEQDITEVQRGIPGKAGWGSAVQRAKEQMLKMRKSGKNDRYIADMLYNTMQNVSIKNMPGLFKAIGLNVIEDSPEVEDTYEDTIAKRKKGSDVHKKQSFSDIFRSMDETEDDLAGRFKKELHDEKTSRALAKGTNGKFSLAEGPGMTTATFESMVEDMKRLMGQGKTISLVAKESHLSDRYKGEIFDYSLTTTDAE